MTFGTFHKFNSICEKFLELIYATGAKLSLSYLQTFIASDFNSNGIHTKSKSSIQTIAKSPGGIPLSGPISKQAGTPTVWDTNLRANFWMKSMELNHPIGNAGKPT